MSALAGIRWYYDLCGIRGVGAIASFRLIKRPRELAVVPRGKEHPVYLRIGTSDFCAYKDTLVCAEKHYDPEIPGFNPRVVVDAGAHIAWRAFDLPGGIRGRPSSRWNQNPRTLPLCYEILPPIKTSFRSSSALEGGRRGRIGAV